jgi:hypothetical protein
MTRIHAPHVPFRLFVMRRRRAGSGNEEAIFEEARAGIAAARERAAAEPGEVEPEDAEDRGPGVRRSGVVLAILVGLVGLGLCVYGGLAYSDARSADDEASEIADERHELEREEAQRRERTLAIQTAANDVNTAIRQLIGSSNDFTAAGRLVTDTANAAVALLNQGNPAGARSTFAETVGPAVAEHEAKLPPITGAPGNLQAALDALQATINEDQ